MKTPTFRIIAAALTFGLAATTLRAQAPPGNDDFANRQVLPSQTQVSVRGDTTNATQEAFEVAYSQGQEAGAGINETRTVWYSYTPPVSGTLHVTYGRLTDGETYFLLFKGGAVPTLAALQSQGYLPGGPGQPAPPDTAVAAGQEYTLSLGNTHVPYPFTLTLTLTPDATTPAPTPAASVVARGKADRATGTPAKLVFTLSAGASAPLTVVYQTGGSAQAGEDYKALPGSVNFAAGQTTATVKVKPRATAAAGTSELTVVVKVKLLAGDGYTVGGGAGAKVKIIGGP